MMKKITDLARKIRYIFDKKQKIKLFLLLVMFTFSGFFELLGVVAIVPMIDVMMDPTVIFRRSYLLWIYTGLSFSSEERFLVFLGISLIIIYILKNLIVSVMYKLQYKFTFSNQRDLAKRLMNCYMSQSYYYFSVTNSADLIRSVNNDVSMMFQGVLSFLQLFAESIVCLSICIYLVIMDKSIAIGVAVFMGIFLLIYTKKFKSYLSRIGQEDRKYTAGIVKWLHQSFGGIKETKVLGREKYFLDHFNYNYDKWADCEQNYRYLQVAPRPILEAVCVTSLLLIIVLKLLNGTSSDYFVSTMAVFAMGAFRLLPSFNRITSYLGNIMFNLPAFSAVYDDIKTVESLGIGDIYLDNVAKKLSYNEKIELVDLSFRYPLSNTDVLKNINISIRKNSSVAFIGPSGAGKTTLADIILGALKPTEGSVYVDGINVFTDLRSWQKNVGYVPQSIYLMDDTIENNILFGAEDSVDEEKLFQAISKAQIREFIDTLPEGIKTVVGEQGIRLSGGQRQRIGIARALYLDPDVLVLDEATSALDNDTEKAVMDAIETLNGHKTLIIIAHRLSTIRNCEYIYKIDNSKVELQDQ